MLPPSFIHQPKMNRGSNENTLLLLEFAGRNQRQNMHFLRGYPGKSKSNTIAPFFHEHDAKRARRPVALAVVP